MPEVHAFPRTRRKMAWCGAGPMAVRTGKGTANKLFKRITCSECRSKIGAFLRLGKDGR